MHNMQIDELMDLLHLILKLLFQLNHLNKMLRQLMVQ